MNSLCSVEPLPQVQLKTYKAPVLILLLSNYLSNRDDHTEYNNVILE